MSTLNSKKLRTIPSFEGVQADVLLTEANGDEYVFRCLCRTDGTTDLGDPTGGIVMDYLSRRYGSPAVCAAARKAVFEQEPWGYRP